MNKKRSLVIEIVLTLLLFTAVIYSSNKEYQNYKNVVNKKVAMIVSNIHDKYPDVSEEEIIKIINDTNTNNDIITKYGYTDDDTYLAGMKNSYYASISINIIIAIIFVVLEIIIYYVYQKAQEKRIKEIDNYLKDINDKKYHLMIEDNNEDELSKLHNELYKTTVMLKENAEHNELEKKQLSDSLADISHQIKTPLTSIRILLDNISDNPDMDNTTKEAFLRDISIQIDGYPL